MNGKRYLILGAVALAAACGSSTTAPSNSNIVFTAQMASGNELSLASQAEAGSTGTATVTCVPTKDANNNITSAVCTANVTTQLPSGSSITLSHIHTGAAGVNGGVLVPFVPTSSVAVTNGSATFSQTTNVTGDQMNSIIANPAGFYYNVHTALNPGGVMRAQLVRTQ